MSLIKSETYTIDFNILENNNPKTIVLLDQSNYLSEPEQPVIKVIIPGFTGYKEFSYIPNSIITINSDILGLTSVVDNNDLVDLPDGVYQIIMSNCPHDELFNKKCYLKATRLEYDFQNILLNLPIDCPTKLANDIIDIQILIASAKAETNICNIERAMIKYQVAKQKINTLIKKLKCN